VKLGVCTSIENAAVVQKAGYDFIEPTVVSLRPEESDRAVADILQQYEESPIPIKAFNVLLPRDLKIIGESIDHDRVTRYLEKALERVKKLGGETIVFGSGGSRTLPDGFSRERGEEQIVQFLNKLADYTDPMNLTIVIEPLYKKASNIINSVPEAVEVAKKVNRKSILVLADFFHMQEENEPLENIVTYRDLIKHIHISDNGLSPGRGQYPYLNFVDCVHRANYDGNISIECLTWNDFAIEIVESKKFLERLFKGLPQANEKKLTDCQR
jgi:sugar phosphate isomerase/epimerase